MMQMQDAQSTWNVPHIKGLRQSLMVLVFLSCKSAENLIQWFRRSLRKFLIEFLASNLNLSWGGSAKYQGKKLETKQANTRHNRIPDTIFLSIPHRSVVQA